MHGLRHQRGLSSGSVPNSVPITMVQAVPVPPRDFAGRARELGGQRGGDLVFDHGVLHRGEQVLGPNIAVEGFPRRRSPCPCRMMFSTSTTRAGCNTRRNTPREEHLEQESVSRSDGRSRGDPSRQARPACSRIRAVVQRAGRGRRPARRGEVAAETRVGYSLPPRGEVRRLRQGCSPHTRYETGKYVAECADEARPS
ncbi:hypothetical protein EBESD8_46740 [Rhodococcus aetherivorans]|nr:hypothetical protein EBESD8_46740 [Rhodococcus aetherivorans]